MPDEKPDLTVDWERLRRDAERLHQLSPSIAAYSAKFQIPLGEAITKFVTASPEELEKLKEQIADVADKEYSDAIAEIRRMDEQRHENRGGNRKPNLDDYDRRRERRAPEEGPVADDVPYQGRYGIWKKE